MAKDKLTDYSATNASNTDVGGVNIDEGMLPSDVNNAIREVMTHLKDFSDGTSGVDVLNLQDDDASASIKIQAPAAVTTTTTFTLPDGDGTSGQVLQTSGTGTLSWTSNGLANVVEDTSPQLGGNLDLNGNDITGTGNISTTGTATFTGDLTVDTNTLHVDSTNNRVGVGTTLPGVPLHISTSGTAEVARFETTTDSTPSIAIYSNGAIRGQLRASTAETALLSRGSTPLLLGTNNTEAARFDSSQNFLVGTTSSGSFSVSDGAMVLQSGRFLGTHSNDSVAALSRRGTDGSIVALYKDSTQVGSIGTQNWGIGTASPSRPLDVVADVNDNPLRLRARGGGTSAYITFSSNDATTTNALIGNPAANTLAFYTNGFSERMRLDASGNLLVGHTGTNIYADTSGSGITANQNGRLDVKRADILATFNRTVTDGEILQFRKDGSVVGSIGTLLGRLSIGTGATGLYFDSTYSQVRPFSLTANDVSDAAIDLGRGSSRFKDLYLSGGAYLGGTGSANLLDDYEEGTFTPTIVYSGTNTPTINTQVGHYTKIGRVVQIQIYLQWDENGSTGNVTLGALPFTSLSGTGRAVPSVFTFGLTGLPTNVSVTGFVQSSNTGINLYLNDNAATVFSATYTDNSNDLYVTVTYTTA